METAEEMGEPALAQVACDSGSDSDNVGSNKRETIAIFCLGLLVGP